MTLQDKIKEFIRETYNMDSNEINYELKDRVKPKYKKDPYYSFLAGVSYAFECVLRLLHQSDINPKL